MSLRKAEIASVLSGGSLAPVARKKKNRIGVEVGGPARCGPRLLRQVFLNLTENAIKFAGGTGASEQATMRVQTDEEGRGLVLFSNRRPAVEISRRQRGGYSRPGKAPAFVRLSGGWQLDTRAWRHGQPIHRAPAVTRTTA